MWHKIAIALAFAFVFWALYLMPAKAEGKVMQFAFCKPESCEETKGEQMLPTEDFANPMKCMIEGMLAAQKWIVENKPQGYVLIHWRCGRPEYAL